MVKLDAIQGAQFTTICGEIDDVSMIMADIITVMSLYGQADRLMDYANRGEESGVLVSSSPVWVEKQREFFFQHPKNFSQTAIMNFCSLLIIKPHVFANHSGDIVQALLDEGFEISAMESRQLDPGFVEEFLDGYKLSGGKLFRDSCLELCSGQSLIVQVRQDNVVEKLRKCCGPIDPEIARAICPESLRARFGIDLVRNAVYCTDLEEDATRDCKKMFE